MKYDHAVKYKGVYYSTGAEVPVEAEKTPEEIEAERLEAEKLAAQAEKEAKIKAVKAMHREELDKYAPTVGITVEETDNVNTLKAKIIAKISE
jgi:hypothetical protein